MGPVLVEGVVHDPGAPGVGQELRTETDKTPGRYDVFQPVNTAHGLHGDHLGPARAELLDDRALVELRNVDDQVFHGLGEPAVHLPAYDFRF